VGSSPAGRIFFYTAAPEVLDQLSEALSVLAPQADFSVIPLHNPRRDADAQIFHRGRVGWESADAQKLTAVREALAALPDVATVGRRGDSLTVRFADARVAQLGEQLEGGVRDALDMRKLLGGAEYLVNFCDANPTKALHIGHLRNIALGQALAGVLSAAGARVTRQSQVSDYCRSMGEALAGYMELPAHITPSTLGVKSDHFVGECFGRYAAKAIEHPDAEGAKEPALSGAAGEDLALSAAAGKETALSAAAAEDLALTAAAGKEPALSAAAAEDLALTAAAAEEPALSAEAAVRHDLAEELLKRWSAGDPEIVERWRRLRGWALEGQDATLAALGVQLDRLVNESDSRPLTSRVLDAGLTGGVFTRLEGGAVVYETGEDEYPRLLLAREDGFPTQHLRTIALWSALRGPLDGTSSIELVGEEWHAYVRYHERLVRELEAASPSASAPAPPPWHPTNNVIYGMVTVEGGAVKSSNGRPPLVDGLLERLYASRELGELVEQSEGRFKPRGLAALIALGFYLGRPTRKPVDLGLTEMLDLSGGVGWELARATVHAWSPRYDGPPDPAPEDGRYRQTVLQTQVHRRLLARAVERLDVYELARFYGHLSRRYLAGEGEARVARAMRPLLGAGLSALGLPCAAPDGESAR
jgi:arginyl-tRNA synthetase